MDLIKYDMTDVWAVAGDVVAPEPEKIRAGWGVEVVPRQWWNWFENRQDNNIAYVLQKGIPEWDATTEYVINKSYVQRNGVVYKATATSTNSDPINLTSWVRAFAESTPFLELIKTLPTTANRVPYTDANGDAQLMPVASTGRQMVAASTPAVGRGVIDAQQANSNLTALSAVTASTNGLPYFTGTNTMGTTVLTSAGRDVLAGADYAAIRSVLQLTNASTRALQTSQFDNTVGSIMTTGAFGMGRWLNLQNTVYITGTPQDIYGSGTIFGFANGGNSGSGLAIPGLTGTWFGTLQVNGQYLDGSGLTAMSRVFVTSGGRTFTQTAASGTAWGAWAENWTSANLEKTQTITDTTPGRLTKVGDFGIGGQGVTVSDLNALSSSTASGVYRLVTPYTGAPFAGPPFTCIHLVYDNERTQIAFPEGTLSPRMFFRKFSGGAGSWGNWVENYNTGNTAQIVADVTAGIQPQLDAKVSKAGDTMTGALYLPNLEVGSASTNGFIDIRNSNANGGNGDFDARIAVDGSVAGTSGSGRLTISATKGLYLNGLLQATAGASVTGNINSSGSISGVGLASSAGLTVTSGTTTLQGLNAGAINGTSVAATNSVSAAGGFSTLAASTVSVRCVDTNNAGNTHLWMYDYSGGERASIYADSGGALHFRTRSQADAITINANRSVNIGGAMTAGGRVTGTDVLSQSTVYSGNGGSWLANDGNIYGGVWGGHLSTYLGNNYIQPGNLGANIVAQTGATGAIGSYGFMALTGSANPNDYVAGSSLRYSGTTSLSGNYATGTWRCMGFATNNASLFMRVS